MVTVTPGATTLAQDPELRRRQAIRGPAALWLLAALVAATAAVNAIRLSDYLHDDAFISLRYARNLATLGDLAWNPGERVEGYTNPLHTLTAAGLIRTGIDGILALRLINAAGLMALWVLTWKLTAGMGTAARLAGMTAVVGAPVLGWTFGGLEAVPAAALVAAAALYALRATGPSDRIALSFAASGLFGLAYLMRPDSLVLNLAVGIAILVAADLPLERRLKHFVALGCVSGLILGLHLVVRQVVYDTWLPLTYYAKVGIGMAMRIEAGASYLLAAGPEMPALILVAAMLFARSLRRDGTPAGPAERTVRIATLTLVLFLAYVIWSGGDHMDYARILVPATPFIAVAVAALAATSCRAGLYLAFGLAGVGLAQAVLRPAAEVDRAVAVGAVVGSYLSATYPPKTTVALATAGSTPYFANGLIFIDTLGLNDPVIARRTDVPMRALMQTVPGHAKGDGAYVLSRHPDIIILGFAWGHSVRQPIFLTDVELIEAPDFARCYRQNTVTLRPPFPVPFDARVLQQPVVFHYFRRTCDR